MDRTDEAVRTEADFTAEVVSGGRITIPKWARDGLHINDGDVITTKIKLMWRKDDGRYEEKK